MKPGITHAYIARLFLDWWSMDSIAEICGCDREYIEQAIRKVMKREKAKRQVRKK